LASSPLALIADLFPVLLFDSEQLVNRIVKTRNAMLVSSNLGFVIIIFDFGIESFLN
jgi:hypothetical protein